VHFGCNIYFYTVLFIELPSEEQKEEINGKMGENLDERVFSYSCV
jgi:hypothetical protein